MAKKIEYNRETGIYNLTETTTKTFSNITKDQLNEFYTLKEDLQEIKPEEYNGRYDRLLFRNQPKVYFVYYPPKSGGGAPHVELKVHPDSTYNFTEFFDPYKYQGSLRVKMADRRFRQLNVSYPDYDLLATFFCMEIQERPKVKLGNCEALLEDKKTTFPKIVEVMNSFNEEFYFNDIKKIFPISKLNEYYCSKVSNSEFFIKFVRGYVKISLISNKRPVLVAELKTNGTINLLIDEDKLQNVIGNEIDYKDTFEGFFNSGRSGFNNLTIELTEEKEDSYTRELFKEYREGKSNTYKIN